MQLSEHVQGHRNKMCSDLEMTLTDVKLIQEKEQVKTAKLVLQTVTCFMGKWRH